MLETDILEGVMNIFSIVLLIIGFAAFCLACILKYEFRNGTRNQAMEREAERVVFENAENTFEGGKYPLNWRPHSTGLALIENPKTQKYNLIAQISVCDTGLY